MLSKNPVVFYYFANWGNDLVKKSINYHFLPVCFVQKVFGTILVCSKYFGTKALRACLLRQSVPLPCSVLRSGFVMTTSHYVCILAIAVILYVLSLRRVFMGLFSCRW